MATFKCVTEWRGEFGHSFRRAHVREALSHVDAECAEIAHNETRMPEMGPDGWTYKVISCVVVPS